MYYILFQNLYGINNNFIKKVMNVFKIIKSLKRRLKILDYL